jgi:hypothetical protein
MGLFGKSIAKIRPHFLIGGEMAMPEEFGQSLYGLSFEPGKGLLNACFGPLLEYRDEAICNAINDQPYAAHLFATSLCVGAYQVYAFQTLSVGRETMDDVMRGVTQAIRELRDPRGQPFSPQHQNQLYSLSVAFGKAISQEISTASEVQSGVLTGNESPVTTLLFEGLGREYPTFSERIDLPELLPYRMALGHMIADTWVGLLTATSQHNLVQFRP